MWLKNAQIYDSRSHRFRRGDIEIAGERIAGLGGKAPAKAEAIDMDGAFLLPGFFDCHVHICVPTDAPDPSRLWVNALPGEIAIYAARAARRLLMCGITTAREVGGWDYH
jgi:imidazolonepropionase-like amidohydrolase